MKEKYMEAEMEIVRLESEDIITTSCQYELPED